MLYQSGLRDAQERVGFELASIYLLTTAWQGIAALQADVRALLGWT